MKYSLYCAHLKDKDIIDITCSPGIDLIFLKERYGVSSIELLTPDLCISHAHYIIRNINENRSSVLRFFTKGSKRIGFIKSTAIKRTMGKLGVKPIRNPEIIGFASPMPGEDSLRAVRGMLKGRIMSYFELNEIIKKRGIFLKDSLRDILQALYLMGKVNVSPSLSIERMGKRIVCGSCGRELEASGLNGGLKCSGCGDYIHIDEPMLLSCHDEDNTIYTPVKFREYKKFTFPQDRASTELCTFLKDDIDACLLWTVPGSEDMNMTSRAIREVLNEGGRCIAAASCRREGIELYNIIKDTFQNNSCVFQEDGRFTDEGDIVVCRLKDIKRYYKAFDLIIINETPICLRRIDKYLNLHIKRALKPKGKMIYATSAPGSAIYKKALKGEVKLVTVPLRAHGRLCPEPRVMTYKALSYDNLFIPGQVIDFITWSAIERIRAHIIVPSADLIEEVRQRLLEASDIREEWINDSNPLILITTLPCMHMYVEEEENVILFFADDSRVFDEKALIDGAGLSGRSKFHKYGEVLFVGSKENEEMHNARMMMRFINKSAWEMGYLK